MPRVSLRYLVQQYLARNSLLLWYTDKTIEPNTVDSNDCVSTSDSYDRLEGDEYTQDTSMTWDGIDITHPHTRADTSHGRGGNPRPQIKHDNAHTHFS